MSAAGGLATPADLIGGQWIGIPGDAVRSRNPAHSDEVVWSGAPRVTHVDAAVHAAQEALPAWSRWGLEKRAAVLRTFQTLANANVDRLAALIRDEVGKAMWDAKAEASLLANKVDITLAGGANSALSRVSGFETPLAPTRAGKCWFRPHGVMAVVGPFNFPVHLPNGHIVPALAMGNTIVFKPSDKAPACGQFLAWLFDEALKQHGAPAGVVNLVHGAADVSSALTSHAEIDGVLFTGSWPVGRRIMEANLDRPGRILALEMGGNNAAVIMPDADLKQAVIECVRSAFVTTGQRCTCTRRLIVHRAVAERVIPAIVSAAPALAVGDPRGTTPVFMGPLVSEGARRAVLDAQGAFVRGGGEALLACGAIEQVGGTPASGWYISPGVMRVERFVRSTGAEPGADIEVFGPLLRVAVVDSLDEAIEQCNATQYGLAASIFTRDEGAIERFMHECRAGCVNVNTGTAGASSKLPFGGLGHSGNHRPAGAFSLDYCAYPVAGMIEGGAGATMPEGMRFEDAWI